MNVLIDAGIETCVEIRKNTQQKFAKTQGDWKRFDRLFMFTVLFSDVNRFLWRLIFCLMVLSVCSFCRNVWFQNCERLFGEEARDNRPCDN